MARTKDPKFNKRMKEKQTARKDKNSTKQPRKQLAKNSKSKKTNTTNNKKSKNQATNKKIAAEKRAIRLATLAATTKAKRWEEQADFSEVIKAYELGKSVLGLLGEPHEYLLPPAVLLENRELAGENLNYAGKDGRKIRVMGDCGLCLRAFRDLTKFKNHMPYHVQGFLYICMFCVLNGRSLINCVFITEDSFMNHMLRYEYSGLGKMAKGKLENPKPQNTPELQIKLAKLMKRAYPTPRTIEFHQKLKKVSGNY